ncbi:TetR/AcrR family transcriptional regulator [Gordonia caeni]|uniref:Helix-turn-helix domain-containing protein n=1 Tax=Gordonia caeni TaxID=1007097 RepID=A0ABP7NIG4_9ACTN
MPPKTSPATPRRAKTQREQETRIIDAAADEFRRSGVRHASIERIAENAGVSRSTLYRRFPSKEDLLSSVIVDMRRTLVREVGEKLAGLDPRATVVEGFALAMTIFREDELLTRIFGESPETVDLLTGVGPPQLAEMVNEFSRGIAATLRAAGASMPDRQLRLAAEVQVRMFVSLTSAPSDTLDIADEAELREFAATLLAPMVW